MPPRVSQGQLERAVGGANNLLQLVDKDGGGDLQAPACQEFIEEVLDEGNGDVNGYIGLAVDLSDPALQTAPKLVRLELAVDAYLLWFKSTGGVAMPDQVQANYDKALGDLGLIRDRKMGIGLAVRPSAAQDVTQVTKADTEPYFSPNSPRRRFDGWS
jgi:hypothetical protein